MRKILITILIGLTITGCMTWKPSLVRERRVSTYVILHDLTRILSRYAKIQREGDLQSYTDLERDLTELTWQDLLPGLHASLSGIIVTAKRKYEFEQEGKEDAALQELLLLQLRWNIFESFVKELLKSLPNHETEQLQEILPLIKT